MNRPAPLQPAFDFSAAPESVSLLQGSVELALDDDRLLGTGEVLLRFLPRPRVVINAKFRAAYDSIFAFDFSDSNSFSFSLNRQKVHGFCTRRGIDADGMELDWSSKVEPVIFGDIQAKTSIAVIAHLFNFPDFRGGLHQATHAPAGCGLLVLESEEWRISLQSLPDSATHKAWQRIQEEGGCFLTHVVKLERKDGDSFSGEEAKGQLLILSRFLSLVKGGRCWTVCEVGMDAADNSTWQSFRAPPHGSEVQSWFGKFMGSQAEALFPLFARRWQQSEAWRDCLTHAVYWYTQANTNGGYPGIDSAIILAQTALERLAHHHVVVDRKMLSAEGFKALKASDKLRMLFSSLNIPTDISGSTPEIQRVSAQCKWVDAPHAMTDVRNALVHPDSKKRVNDCYVDAWKLSLWYLELSILALCDYADTYENRLTATHVGQVDHVPWTAARKET